MSAGALAVIVAAMAIGAVAKGFTGTGLPTIAIPVMAGFLGVERAVVIMAIPTVVTNTWLLWEHRRHAGGTRDLPVMVLCGVVGVSAGVWALISLDPRVLSLTLAVVIAAYVLTFALRPDLRLPARVTRYLSPPVGLAGGALAGATGMAGPLIATYVHGFRLEPGAYVFAITLQFQVFALVQVAGLAAVGLYTPARVWESIIALVPIVLAMPAGMWLARRVEPRRFELAVLAMLVLMGVKLAVDGLSA